jgi:DNA polymerase-4
MVLILDKLSKKVEALLSSRNTSGLTLTLKVKYDDFQNVTRSLTRVKPIEDAATILSLAEEMLVRTEAGMRPVRLLGLTISNLTTDIPVDGAAQMELPFN